MSAMKKATKQQGQSSLFDGPAGFAKLEPEVVLAPEDSCSACMDDGPWGTATPSVESPAEETGSQAPAAADEAESEPQQEEETGPETNMQTMTLDDLMSETESEALFGETRIDISLTLMPGDGDKTGRQIVGSVGAGDCEFLFFSARGVEEAAIRKLEEALARFKRELPRRLKKPAAKATPRLPAKTAAISAKKQTGSRK